MFHMVDKLILSSLLIARCRGLMWFENNGYGGEVFEAVEHVKHRHYLNFTVLFLKKTKCITDHLMISSDM